MAGHRSVQPRSMSRHPAHRRLTRPGHSAARAAGRDRTGRDGVSTEPGHARDGTPMSATFRNLSMQDSLRYRAVKYSDSASTLPVLPSTGPFTALPQAKILMQGSSISEYIEIDRLTGTAFPRIPLGSYRRRRLPKLTAIELCLLSSLKWYRARAASEIINSVLVQDGKQWLTKVTL